LYSKRLAHIREQTRGRSLDYWVPVALTIGPAVIAVVLIGALSLGWAQIHDTPIFLYEGRLVLDGTVPYRDLFEVNMPGTFAVYGAVAGVLGTSDLAVRVADLACLAVVSVSTWLFVSRIDRVAAASAVAVFAWVYFSFGPGLALQRDFLLLVPLSVAIVCASRHWRSTATKLAVVGLLFGLTPLFKPHALIGALPVLWYAAVTQDGRPVARRAIAVFFAALLAPLATAFTYLLTVGALDDFWSIAHNYWPLFGRLDGTHTAVAGWARLENLVEGVQDLGGDAVWLIPAALATYSAVWLNRENREASRAAIFLSLMTAAFAIYPAGSGQFFGYHWTPFRYFVVMLASLCFVRYARPSGAGRHMAFAMLLPLLLSPLALRTVDIVNYSTSASGLTPELEVKLNRVKAIEAFLRENQRPGDEVQPLDWTGGAVHAMLRADSKIATPYIYDVQFYHHVTRSYIQDLRRQFAADVRRSRPRFIVEILQGGGRTFGAETTREFPELRALINERYMLGDRGDFYVIHVLRDQPVAP
jgi:hypothetical protein